MIAGLWWAMLAGAGGLTVLVLALFAWAFRRRGPEREDVREAAREAAADQRGLTGAGAPPSQRRAPGEGFWALGMGLGFTLSILVALSVAGFYVGEKLQPLPGADHPLVLAEARQWSWRFTQTHPRDGEVVTENILYIPAGRPVSVDISSLDVVHSFWVPRLAGKLDAVPGHVNRLRLEADQPGIYHGRSAEFSGRFYAGMQFIVVAYDEASPPDFTDGPAAAMPEGQR